MGKKNSIVDMLLKASQEKAYCCCEPEIYPDLLCDKCLLKRAAYLLNKPKNEDSGDFLKRLGTNHELWAEEYRDMYGGDLGTLKAWFANAMMASYDDGRKRLLSEIEGVSAPYQPPGQGIDFIRGYQSCQEEVRRACSLESKAYIERVIKRVEEAARLYPEWQDQVELPKI